MIQITSSLCVTKRNTNDLEEQEKKSRAFISVGRVNFMSFFPLFVAATHVLRLNATNHRAVSVVIIIEQTEVAPDRTLAAPTRTVFSKTSLPIHTDRVPGFRAHATREWLNALKNTAGRTQAPASTLMPATTSSSATADGGSKQCASWDVAMVQHCEGTMLVKESSRGGANNANDGRSRATTASRNVDDQTGVPITVRAQILGERHDGTAHVIGESATLEISAARVLLVRKVQGLTLHTSAGDVGVVVSVAREDATGCQRRVVDFLAQHSTLPAANAAAVARNLIAAANGDEIMVFSQLRRKFGLTDYESRLTRYLQLYSLDEPTNFDVRDEAFAQQLLRAWAPTEELLFVALSTMFGPEQEALSAWIRLRALNSVTHAVQQQQLRPSGPPASASAAGESAAGSSGGGGGGGGGTTTLYATWRKELRELLTRGGDATDLDMQAPVHSFFRRCCAEVAAAMRQTAPFREPPPYLYLFDTDVRGLLRVDSFGGFAQSVLPGDIEADESACHAQQHPSTAHINADLGDLRQLDDARASRARNHANVLVDVLDSAAQTASDAPDVRAAETQCDRATTATAATMASDTRLTSTAAAQTRADDFFRDTPSQSVAQELSPTTDAYVDAMEPPAVCAREIQTDAVEVPRRTVRVSTVDDLPPVAFEHEVMARALATTAQMEDALSKHGAARRRAEQDAADASASAEAARRRLADELALRQQGEVAAEAVRGQLADANATLARLQTQSKLVEVERKDAAARRDESRTLISELRAEVAAGAEREAQLTDAAAKRDVSMATLAADLAETRSNFAAMTRQCDLLADDAKASRAATDSLFSQLRETENKLHAERDERAMYQEQVETTKQAELLLGLTTADSLQGRIRALEAERDALVAERADYLANGVAALIAARADEEAARARALSPADAEFRALVQQARERVQRHDDALRERAAAASTAAASAVAAAEQRQQYPHQPNGAIGGGGSGRVTPVVGLSAAEWGGGGGGGGGGRDRDRGTPTRANSSGLDFALARPRLPSHNGPLGFVDEDGSHLPDHEQNNELTPAPAPAPAPAPEQRPVVTTASAGVQARFAAETRDQQQQFATRGDTSDGGASSSRAAGARTTPASATRSQARTNTLATPTREAGGAAELEQDLGGGGGGAGAARKLGGTPSYGAQHNNHLHHQLATLNSPGASRAAMLARPGALVESSVHSPSTAGPRAFIEEGWRKQRSGLSDAARACWEQAAAGASLRSAEASQPMHVGARYEAEGLLSELVHHDVGRAAELYSMAIKYWPNQAVIMRLAGLHDREESGDRDVAVDLYRLAAGMGSQTAKLRLMELLAP